MRYSLLALLALLARLVVLFALLLSCSRLEEPARSETSSVESDSEEAPSLVLWAWERPEDLRFLEGTEVQVAYLARTVTLAGDEVRVRPRLVPLRLPPSVKPIAVARIETPRGIPPSLSPGQLEATVRVLAELGSLRGISEVQIDFDATVSQRKFYRELLQRLRLRLPRALPLSITALASWCLEDRWMEALPIDDAIPMLFRMGREADVVKGRLARGETFREPLCRRSVGLATDEWLPRFPSGERIYLFHPRAWTEADYLEAVRVLPGPRTGSSELDMREN